MGVRRSSALRKVKISREGPGDIGAKLCGIKDRERLRWSRGSVLAFSTQVRGFKPGQSRRIFRAKKKSSARLPSEGK